MAYEIPITTYPVNERFENVLIYEDLSIIPSFSFDNTPVKQDN